MTSAADVSVNMRPQSQLSIKKGEIKAEYEARKAEMLGLLGDAQKGRNMFFDPTAPTWARKSDDKKAMASRAGQCSFLTFVLTAIIFIIAVMIPMDLMSASQVIKSESNPSYEKYNNLLEQDLEQLTCPCSETSVFASDVASWSYTMDEICKVGPMIVEAYPSDDGIAMSFFNFFEASGQGEVIPAFFITAIGKLAETCDIAEGLMGKAGEKFDNTALYTPNVLTAAELKARAEVLLLDADFVWPAFFDLHSKSLDIWGSITRPLSPDTYTRLQDDSMYGNLKSEPYYRSCYAGGINDADSAPIVTQDGEINGVTWAGDVVDEKEPRMLAEFQTGGTNALYYDMLLFNNPDGKIAIHEDMAAECGTTGDDFWAFEEKLYCNSYKTFLEFPLKEVTEKMVELCTAGEATFLNAYNAKAAVMGDMILATSKMGYEKPKDLIANMMLAGKTADTLKVDHAKHFEICAPAECTYIESETPSGATVFGIMVGIYGGFHAIAMTFLFPMLVFPLFCVCTGAMTFAEMRAVILGAAFDEASGEAADFAEGEATKTAEKVGGI